jgi:hypothetical protein
VGGYVNGGLYNMHPGEFVMNSETTSAAERLAQGQLSQDAVLGMLASGGGGGGGRVVWNDNRRFDSRLSVEDRRAINNDTKRILEEAFSYA